MSDDAQKVTEALRDSRLAWGTHSDRWSDREWQDRFWAEVVAAALAALDLPARDARVAAAALREAADKWQQGQWSDVLLPKPAPPAVPVIAYANRVGDWLRDRANAMDDTETEPAEHPTRARLRALIDQRRLDTDDLPAPVPVEELRAILDET